MLVFRRPFLRAPRIELQANCASLFNAINEPREAIATLRRNYDHRVD